MYRRSARTVAAFLVMLATGGWGSAKMVDVNEAEQLLRDQQPWILDVRSAEEYAAGHLQKAHTIPVQDLEKRLSDLPSNKAKPILLYCKSGKRSAQADGVLTKLGFTSLYILDGGLAAWQAARKPVVKSEAPHETSK